MNETVTSGRPRRDRRAIIGDFLGSMPLAISLLVVVAIASIIGTVLQQNQPYNDYLIKFGPFWFEVFKSLGLFHIYGSPWFLVLLGFLLTSTSVCIYRHFPQMVREMTQFRLNAADASLRAFHLKAEWASAQSAEQVANALVAPLTRSGFRVRRKGEGDRWTIAGLKGASNRLGYLFSHIGIVVICVGGLIDGNLGLRWAELTGAVQVEKRDLPVSEIPEKSFLAADNSSFRGSVSIPEGQRADFVFLPVRDGYLVQRLPFGVALDDFRIEYYNTGMPKSFESDLVIFDDDLKEPLRKTIAVNHPLVYKGYAIYQSNFADGGSRLDLKAWSLDDPRQDPLTLSGRVNQSIDLETSRGTRTVELNDFKLYNIFPNENADQDGHKFRNFGPSFIFRLRAPTGEALEYLNYLAPVEVNGRLFYLSGMRSSPAEDYRYLHIPVDSNGGIDQFFAFLTAARDPKVLQRESASQVSAMGIDPASEQGRIAISSMVSLVNLFIEQGIEAVVEHTNEKIAEAERAKAMESYVRVIQGVLGSVYLDLLQRQGMDLDKAMADDSQAQFFDDAVTAFSLLGTYGSPVYLQLTGFDQVEASGLQITRAPGQDIVYLGCVMLMAGVFLLFYVHHRRIWVRIEGGETGSRLLVAGTAQRERGDFTPEFNRIVEQLRRMSGADNGG